MVKPSCESQIEDLENQETDALLNLTIPLILWHAIFDDSDDLKTGVLLIALPRSPQGGSSGWREICIASLSATSANLPWQLIATIISTEDVDDHH